MPYFLQMKLFTKEDHELQGLDAVKEKFKKALKYDKEGNYRDALCEYEDGLATAIKVIETSILPSQSYSDQEKDKYLVFISVWAMKAQDTLKKVEADTTAVNIYGACDNIDLIVAGLEINCELEPLDITLDDLVGLKGVKRDLMEDFVYPVCDPECFRRDKKRLKRFQVLSYGPPGTAKSAVASAVLNEVKPHYDKAFAIGADFIKSSWSGQAAKNVAAIEKLIKKNSPCFLVLEEVDSVFREDKSHHDDGSKAEFLRMMDPEKAGMDGVVIFCSTNNPEVIREAFHRRFDHVFYHGMPKKKVRKPQGL